MREQYIKVLCKTACNKRMAGAKKENNYQFYFVDYSTPLAYI